MVFLTQCDTTAGLLGRDPQVLNALKGRSINQPVLTESPSLAALKTLVRVPKAHRSRLRRAKHTSFIYPNGKAVRLVGTRDMVSQAGVNDAHSRFLSSVGALYSTSANKSGEDFKEAWAREVCDVMVLDSRGLYQGRASKIYAINHTKIQRRR